MSKFLTAALAAVIPFAMFLGMPGTSIANSHDPHAWYYADIYQVQNPGSHVDLHQWSQARGKVKCRVPHNQFLWIADDRGRFKYGVWVRPVGALTYWEDPHSKKMCSKDDRRGWIDTWDHGVRLKKYVRGRNIRLELCTDFTPRCVDYFDELSN